jgi:predicted ATP-dependent endonuclease of OLD family
MRGPLVAIVGPNEAGKTSFLKAIRHLSREDEFSEREFTGRQSPSPRRGDNNPIIVSARFELTADDRAHAKGLDAKTEYVFEKRKRANGAIRWLLSPSLQRDLRPRRSAAVALEKVMAKDWPSRVEGDELDELKSRLEALARVLESDDEHLTEDDEIALMREVAASLREAANEDTPKKVAVLLPEKLDQLADFESGPHPNDVAGQALNALVPRFLLFDDEERALRTSYSWADHVSAPPALDNLLEIAGVDFDDYKGSAMDASRTAELATMERNANRKLKEVFRSWNQADLTVELKASASELELLVFDEGTEEHTRFGDRSAGLRSFVALVAFAARYSGDQPPVLLIDEAETHLHYGAQADLVRVFERQSVAHKVIYTTHSIGCLPEDLGTTLRAIAPIGGERSEVRNYFWTEGAGMTPMMLAMGANALAFTPSRFAVIAEGATEAILLPSMLREALGSAQASEPLGFQVVPGVSEVDPEDAADLEFHAGGVVYLIDADDGGRTHRRKLSERAKAERRVVELGGGREPDLSIEDFVDGAVLTAAFNEVLDKNSKVKTSERVLVADLPKTARAAWLDAWCLARGEKKQSKTVIAQAVLKHAEARGGLIQKSRRRTLQALHRQLLEAVKRQHRPDAEDASAG